MDDLEAARQRKLAELQAQQARAQQDAQVAAQKRAQEEAAMDGVLQQILEPEARERLTRIRMSRPDLASDVTRQLVAAMQQGRIARRMTDADLRQVLGHLAGPERDIKITRK
jgi:programmed cell death protein 5